MRFFGCEPHSAHGTVVRDCRNATKTQPEMIADSMPPSFRKTHFVHCHEAAYLGANSAKMKRNQPKNLGQRKALKWCIFWGAHQVETNLYIQQ
jgi:hypothetical protein